MNVEVNKLKALLKVKGAKGLLLESKAMKRYVGTLTGGGCAVFLTEDASYLLFDGRYLEEARTNEKTMTLVHIERGKKALYDTIRTMVGSEDTVLVESEVSYEQALLMQGSGLNIQLCGDELLGIRAVKNKEGISSIEHVVNLTDEIFQKILKHIRVGMTERELCAYVYYESFAHGAEAMAFEPIIISGERTALPHGRASDRVIQAHEPIMIDFGIQVNGYQSDMTRMVSIGEPSDQMKTLYAIVLEAQIKAIDAVCEGATAKDVDAASRNIISEEGYGDAYLHGLGHGIGVDNSSEHPYLNQSSQHILKEGMAMTCEPGVYLSGIGGIRIEDIVIVKDGKGVSVTHTPKDQFIIVEGHHVRL